MTGFHEREQAFEAKFAHDAEVAFLATARRDRLFAEWAAERLLLSKGATVGLVSSLQALGEGPGRDTLLVGQVANAFTRYRQAMPYIDIVAALADCAARARQQATAGLLDDAGARLSP